jgi:hypothetical protein
MGIISVDRSGTMIAIKLTESSKIDPEKLMEFVGANENASFSPNGIIRFQVSDNPLEAATDLLRTIRA